MPLDIFTPNVLLSEFALRLRKYRQDNGLSFGEVARRLGVSLERLGRLELDREQPSRFVRRRFDKLAKQKTASPK